MKPTRKTKPAADTASIMQRRIAYLAAKAAAAPASAKATHAYFGAAKGDLTEIDVGLITETGKVNYRLPVGHALNLAAAILATVEGSLPVVSEMSAAE